MLIASFTGKEVVELNEKMINELKKDPAMVALEKRIIEEVKMNKDFGKKGFYDFQYGKERFGGQWFENGKPNFGVFTDTNAWAVGDADIRYWVEVNKKGEITIEYRLQDEFDYKYVDGKNIAYNGTAVIIGTGMYEIAGANEHLQTRASWTSKHK